jgi:hypothetical protein
MAGNEQTSMARKADKPDRSSSSRRERNTPSRAGAGRKPARNEYRVTGSGARDALQGPGMSSSKNAATRRDQQIAGKGRPRLPKHLVPSSSMSPNEYECLRQAFWENIIGEMLMSMSAMVEKQKDVFDGRVAVLTKGGERVPIADVTPLFAMTMIDSKADRDASRAVQCTVFRITTPAGEVFTLPLHEIRALHSLTPELIERIQQEREEEDVDQHGIDRPFGFAAFQALPKPAEPVREAPEDPME